MKKQAFIDLNERKGDISTTTINLCRSSKDIVLSCLFRKESA